MYSFSNDYSECAHPRILAALNDLGIRQHTGYGLDTVCDEAIALIRSRCAAPHADVHFAVGGTQANLLVIHAALRSFESVIAASTAHVNVHETGAIETTGHKVCVIETPDGKLTPDHIRKVVSAHASEHMVAPKLVYISNVTEVGTIYSKAELQALRRCCDECGLYLYMDGARLASALSAPGNDLTMQDIAALTDAFYIGGTKDGAMFGEAIVLLNDALKPNFRWYIKQRGAMMAKGFLLGVQFRELLKDDLYFELARHANAMAARMRDGMLAKGYRFPLDSRSNLLFPILPDESIRHLQKLGYTFEVDEPADHCSHHTRFVTSWATPQDAIDAFLADLPTV